MLKSCISRDTNYGTYGWVFHWVLYRALEALDATFMGVLIRSSVSSLIINKLFSFICIFLRVSISLLVREGVISIASGANLYGSIPTFLE